MSRRLQASRSTSQRNKKTFRKSDIGVVVDVILDDTHERVVSLEIDSDYESKKTELIGACVVRLSTDVNLSDEELRSYKPLYNLDISVPLIGETVQLVKVGDTSYYRRLTFPDINQGNAEPNKNKNVSSGGGDDGEPTGGDYSTVSQTGTSNSSGDDRATELGEYFESTQINPLKLYEGDRLIQGRYGQSIRFSGYNNEDNILSPTILIRNRQSPKSVDDLKKLSQTEENLVDDGSTIAMTSNEYLLNFTPGTIDTPLETEPFYHEAPEELKGTDQILINSGRIILSSKDSEMIFFSKGDYSFISDGKLTIDNGNDGALIDLNGEYRTTTNDNNMYFLGGSGEIYLNTESDAEPLVRGDTLVKLLKELIDAINAQIFSTPAGPTATGPNNRADFNSIKSELDTILSTLNYTE